MSDQAAIPAMVRLATNPVSLHSVQQTAAARLLHFDGEIYPSDGCAITLSVLMQQAGMSIPDIFKAIELGDVLVQSHGWVKIPVGQQKTGDVGSTCGSVPHHGVDHVYFVLKPVNEDEMIVADNQSTAPHFRFASGHGKSPTQFFLRAT